MNFQLILDEFKNNESPENIVPLIEDVSLRNGLVSWKSIVIENLGDEECPYNDEVSKWKWLWTRIKYDVGNFGVVAGCKPQESIILLQRLIGLRLIYPDGTLNKYATQYLQSMIMAKIQGGSRGRPKK